MISVAPAVPAVSVHQCHLSVPINDACQCPSVPPISAANQCHLSLPVSAAYQCASVLHISAT
ncbi:unnamed protein product [Staurois parvus]|uniref:Uncharacterized protein n=1 Tax=Staurois parvus TaxID=386267 RepID=A0ABN9GE17_9NEOB|nr:unnamed protein product [Staurois parvus]